MGHRQSRLQVLSLLAAAGAACGSSSKASEEPRAKDVSDAGNDEAEVAQIKAISNAVNEFGPAVHTCWARAAADDFRLEGRVVLELELKGDGGASVSVSEEDAGDALLSECLVSLWSDYQWPLVFAAGDRIQLPPFEFVAPDAQYSVASSHVPRHQLGESLEVRVVLDAANSGNAQGALSLLSVKNGLEVPLHSHPSAELLFVLAGTGVLESIGGPKELGPGSAVYLPAGAVHGFKQTGDETTELLQFYAPGGPEGRFKDPSKTAGTTPFTGTLPKKGQRALVRNVSELKALSLMAGKGELLMLFDEDLTKDTAAYLGALRAEPGASVPAHRHSESSEYLFVLEGQAEMHVAGRAITLQAGDALQVPPGVEHSASIVGGNAFKAIQFYTPAGPEQRFKGGNK